MSWIRRSLNLTLRHVDNDGNEQKKIDEEAVKWLCELLDKEIAIDETNNIIDVSKSRNTHSNLFPFVKKK